LADGKSVKSCVAYLKKDVTKWMDVDKGESEFTCQYLSNVQ